MIEYYLDYAFDNDTKSKMKKKREKIEYECKQNRYSSKRKNIVRERSRSRSRDRIKAKSDLELVTVHDLCRRVHINALHAPTKWRKHLGLRHLRILFDILIDPLLATKVKNNGFLKDERGRKYLRSLEQVMSVRVFCKGKHRKDRIEGVLEAKPLSNYSLTKFYREFVDMVDFYQTERKKKRKKYKEIVDGMSESDEDGNEIRLSLKIKNKKNTKFKHRICIDGECSESTNNININIKTASKKRTKLSALDRLKEPNPTKKREDLGDCQEEEGVL